MVPLADVLPDDKYTFAPAPGSGQFTGVRTFAQQVKHLAANNYQVAMLIVGRTPSAEMRSETGPDSVRAKAEIMRYRRGSFVALHEAVGTIDAANIVTPIETPITWQRTRLCPAIDAVAHSYDHYGQLVEYLRMSGMVPPASRRATP